MRHIPNLNHKHVQNTQTNPVHYHINPIIQIIPNDDRVGHAMASWPGAWKPKAHACMPQKVAPQWHVNPVRHMHFPAAAPAPAESVAKGLSSGETTSTTAPRDHHTRRRGTLEGRRGRRFWRHTCRLLLVQVTIALGVGVQPKKPQLLAHRWWPSCLLRYCSSTMAAGPNRGSARSMAGLRWGGGTRSGGRKGLKRHGVKVCQPNKVMNS